jgi:hypothetical protein
MGKAKRNARQQANAKLARRQELIPAVLGNGSGTTTVPGSKYLCYVRVGGRQVPIVVRNTKTPHVSGLPVWVGRDELDNRIVQVLGTRSDGAFESSNNPNIGPHADSHLWGGADPVFIDTKQIVELNVYAAGGLSVGVMPGLVPTETGGFTQVIPNTLDLSGNVPAAGYMRFVLVQVNAVGTVTVKNGAEFDPAFSSPVYIPPPDAGNYALAGVRLRAGQIAISNNITDPDIYDLRFVSGLSASVVGSQYAIRLYGSGAIKSSYVASAAGLTGALAAATAGDTILLPLEFTVVTDLTVPNDVTILGDSRDSINIVGQITCTGTARFRGVTIKAISGDASNKKGLVVTGVDAVVTLIDVGVWAGTTSSGSAYGISVEAAGALVQARECFFNGYGDHHRMFHFGGQAGQSATVRQSTIEAEFITNDAAKLLTSGNTFGADADSYGTPIVTTDRAPYNHLHDDRYFTETELATSGAGGQVHWDNILGKPLISTTLFLHEEAADVAGYGQLLTLPAEDAENIVTATTVNADTEYLLQEFISYPPAGMGITLLSGGVWEFVVWGKVSNAAGVTKIVARVYKRDTGGTETELFAIETDEIDATSAAEFIVESTQPDYILTATDRLVIKYYARSTVGASQVVSFYFEGATHYSHVHTPGGVGSGTPTIREVLTANRTYYVRTDGSDSNTGLANTAGGAFLTIQKAVDVVSTLDINSKTVTIQVADGTYTGAVNLKNVIGCAAAGDLTIQGNAGTPANVVISTTGADCIKAVGLNTPWYVKDMKLTAATSGNCIAAENGAYIQFANIDFGTVAAGNRHLRAADHGMVVCAGNYVISGGATNHIVAVDGTVRVASRTVTISGTPAFTAFVNAFAGGVAFVYSNTFSGSATGSRYSAATNGVIYTLGATLPGDAAGSTATGGQYT